MLFSSRFSKQFALAALYGVTFQPPPVAGAMAGVSIVDLYNAVVDYLKDKNAFDPDVPDKCVLNVSTYAGGDCTGNIQCDETDQPGADIGAFPNCALNGVNNFTHPLIGDYSIEFTKAGGVTDNTDGLHGPVYRFANIGNWDALDVEGAIQKMKDENSAGGALCGTLSYSAGTQTLGWGCGVPQLNTALFGIDNSAPVDNSDQGFTPGWCTMHVVQYQKNENGVGAQYEFSVNIFDNDKKTIGQVQNVAVDPNTLSIDVSSHLPAQVIVTAGATDDIDPTFAYNGQTWTCGPSSKGGDHQCDSGSKSAGAGDHGFENGNRESDMGFTC